MNLNKFSKSVTQDPSQPASQAMLHAIGLTENDFKKAFTSKNRNMCAPPAPAHGLYLTKVVY